MTQGSLFPESVELRRSRLDGEIVHLLCGGHGGPLKMQLEDSEKAVLDCLRFRRGIKNAMPIREIEQRAKISPRSIKEAVRGLRINFRLPIGSWKHSERGGYYLVETEEDLAAWVKDLSDQIRAEAQVLRSACGDQAVREMLGQIRMEMEEVAHG